MFLPINISESSREYDDLFQITERSKKVDGGYTPYTWKYEKSKFFRGCDTTKVFPLSVNLYLKTCTEEELADLLNKEHFLRISMYYNVEETQSFISVMNLTIADLRDEEYKKLMLNCRNVTDMPFSEQIRRGMIPCEITMGPFWYFLGTNKMMFENRRIENGCNMIVPGRMPPMGYIMGLEMIGRDAFPGENEEQIQEAKEIDGIFIIRK